MSAVCRGLLRAVALMAALGMEAVVARADPHADYMLHCQGCHGPGGEGAPGGVPSFRGTLGRLLSAPGGREYVLRVPGTAQSELSDARVAAVLNWMMRTFSPETLPVDAAPFTEAEVARLRKPPLIDVAATRQRLLRHSAARDRAGVDRSGEN